jgi:tubulin beta
VIDEVMDRIRQAAEKCETLEGFTLTHSLGGGTGSGLGSRILKEVRSEFSDKIISSYSVVSSPKVSDVVVEPYNNVLAWHYLIEDCDLNIILDNEALYSLLSRQKISQHPTFANLNTLIQQNILATTASLRFGGL